MATRSVLCGKLSPSWIGPQDIEDQEAMRFWRKGRGCRPQPGANAVDNGERRSAVHSERFSFDPVQGDGITCEPHVVIDSWGEIRKRKKNHPTISRTVRPRPANEEDIPACGDFGDPFGAMALHS